MAGGSCQYVTVAAAQQTGDVAGRSIAVKVVGGNVLKAFPVVSLEGSEHTHIEDAALVLRDAVDIVAGHAQVLSLLLFQDERLIPVITIESITCCYP